MPKPDAALRNFSAVIITGGSSGIGKSFIELGSRMRPGLAFCNLSRRKPVIDIPELNLRHIPCDLSRPDQLNGALPEIQDFLTNQAPAGRILLVNNSGFGIYGRFADTGIDQQLEMVDVNVRAVLQLTGLLLPSIRARGGAIVTVASTAAFQPTPFLDTYGATKAFVLHWSLGLNEELRGTGVRTLAVCPGPTSTEFFRRAGLGETTVPDPLGQTSEQVVIESLRALAAGKAMVVSGWKNRLATQIVTKLPKPLVARLAARVMARWRMSRVGS
ncbi:MAG TPA: SDR family NAD(P)-dependent oxidoreductase [Opitutaceae bacterium]|nr:SDR family NAD(P)-dependent oxidoreductase [Opitutaceae bacterium]